VPRAPSPSAVAADFFASYLRFSYGQGGKIAHASAALARRIEAQPPQVPEAVRARRARIVELSLETGPAGSWEALAVVSDGRSRNYTLLARLARADGRLEAVGFRPWG
jgi:hypothetical protein